MQLKRLAIMTALVSSVALGSASVVLADNPTPTPSRVGARQTEVAARPTVDATGRQTAVADRQSADLTARRSREVARIDGRIDLLNKLIARLQSDSKLSAADKALLLSEDQAAVSRLTALRAKIAADTTTADLAADAAQTASDHIRDILVPQNDELIMVDNLQATSATIATNLASLQTKISALQSQGVDVSAIQALLTDASSKVTAINSLLLSDQKSLEAITPGSASPSGTFSQVRTDIKTARGDFTAIRDDFKKIREDAKVAKGGTPAPAVTPTPTP